MPVSGSFRRAFCVLVPFLAAHVLPSFAGCARLDCPPLLPSPHFTWTSRLLASWDALRAATQLRAWWRGAPTGIAQKAGWQCMEARVEQGKTRNGHALLLSSDTACSECAMDMPRQQVAPLVAGSTERCHCSVC